MAVSDWSTTPATNATAPGITWAEGQLPQTVNDSARQMMADIKSWYDSNATALTGKLDTTAGAVGTTNLANAAVTTAKTADGFLSADAAGRAKMADGFLSADAAGRAKMADGFFSADTAGRAKMAASFVTPLMLDSAGSYTMAGLTVGGLTLAPRPQSATGVGQWTSLNTTSGAAAVLPAGGTWAWTVTPRDSNTNGFAGATAAGVAAGGTTIASASSNVIWQGFAWRIA